MKIGGSPRPPRGPEGPRGPDRPDAPKPPQRAQESGLHRVPDAAARHAPPLPRSGWSDRGSLLREIGRSGAFRRVLHPRPNFRMIWSTMRRLLSAAAAFRDAPPTITPKYGGPLLGPGLQPPRDPVIVMKYGIAPGSPGPPAGSPTIVARYGIAPGGSLPPPDDPAIVMKYGVAPGSGDDEPAPPSIAMKYGAPSPGRR